MFRTIAWLFLALLPARSLAQETPLRVNSFPISTALPLFAGVAQGIFQRHGLKVELQLTPNSQKQREGLAAGAFEIAHSAADNAVAMVEIGKHDVIIVTGGDSSMNELFAQPDIRAIADLKGRIVAVDAPNTAYALQAKKILLLNGLKEGADYTIKSVGSTLSRYNAIRQDRQIAATMLNPPFSVDARTAGLNSLGRAVDLIGPYQAISAFVLRSWAKANADALERYIAAYVDATRWSLDSANKAAATSLLMEHFKLDPKVADGTWELLADTKFGLARDARFDMQGFRNVLALRAEIEGSWGGKAPAPERYIDLSYYENALKKISR
jgi:ABC-type nitrate/sulfonate/bicarbonate transport system substrate-binding protein